MIDDLDDVAAGHHDADWPEMMALRLTRAYVGGDRDIVWDALSDVVTTACPTCLGDVILHLLALLAARINNSQYRRNC